MSLAGSVNVYSLQRLAERGLAKAGTPAQVFAPAAVEPRDMRELRLLTGLDYTQLAERAGVTCTTVSRIEKGEYKNLRGVTLEKIAIALMHALKDRGIALGLSLAEIELIVIRGKK